LPVAEQYCRETLSLPIYAELTDEQIRFVAQKVQRALEQLETRVSA
jgi:dTDP-4-amino-4,6-dideoxygalactose transaminase